MAKFDDYTQKNTPEDNDITLILDKTANVNKKTPFSGIWTWIVNKMTNAVIQNLQTSNKTMIGAINELNSNIDSAAYEKGTRIPRDSNLNNYTDPGAYYVENSSDASTIQNYPAGVSVGCRIEVRVSGASWIHQRLYPNNNSDVYDRFTDSSYTFNTPWYRIQSTSVN